MARHNQDQGEIYAFIIIGGIILAAFYLIIVAALAAFVVVVVAGVSGFIWKYCKLGWFWAQATGARKKLTILSVFLFFLMFAWFKTNVLLTPKIGPLVEVVIWPRAYYTASWSRLTFTVLDYTDLSTDARWDVLTTVISIVLWFPSIIGAILPTFIYGLWVKFVEVPRFSQDENTTADSPSATAQSGAAAHDPAFDYDPSRFAGDNSGGAGNTQRQAYSPVSEATDLVAMDGDEDATDARLWAVAEDTRTSEEERQAAMRVLRKRGGRKV